MKHETKFDAKNPSPPCDRDFVPVIDEHGFFHNSKLLLNLIGTSRHYPPFPEPLLKFIFRFETACVVDCCGVDAFQFSPVEKDLSRWKFDSNLQKILNEEITKVESFPAQVLTISELNQNFLKEDLLFLLSYLADGLTRSRYYR